MDERVLGLTGGQKHKWLVQHQEEILKFYDTHAHDFELTRTHFGMGLTTLRDLLYDHPRKMKPFTKVDALESHVEILEAEVADLRKVIDFLISRYGQFETEIAAGLAPQIASVISKTLAGRKIIPGELAKKDNLILGSL